MKRLVALLFIARIAYLMGQNECHPYATINPVEAVSICAWVFILMPDWLWDEKELLLRMRASKRADS